MTKSTKQVAFLVAHEGIEVGKPNLITSRDLDALNGALLGALHHGSAA